MDNSLYIGPDTAPDRYRLVRSIGRGGEATLYLAELKLAGETEPVVVKVLDSKVTLSPEHFAKVSEKWNEQAELLRFVHRLGVVGVREHFEGPPTHRQGKGDDTAGRALYLVMNHVDGLDLRDWRAERSMDTPGERRETMRCLEQLADVLDWLHLGKGTPSGRTVVHGDLSPGNVMVDGNGQATLVDFGLSKLTADHQTVEVWFTPGYAAPEVFEGKRSPATDRYAFGAIAYFLLSGESPPSTPEQLRAAFRQLPVIATVDEERVDRILSVFSPEPRDRPDTLSSWVRELRFAVVSTKSAAADSVGQPAPPSTPPPPARPPADAVPPPPKPAFGPALTGSSVPPVPPPTTVPPSTPLHPPAAFSASPTQPTPPAQPTPPPPVPTPTGDPFPAQVGFQTPAPQPAPVPQAAPVPQPEPVVTPEPAPGADTARLTVPDPVVTPRPAPEPSRPDDPEPPRRRGRRGLKVAGAVLAMLVVAGATAAGMKALEGDDEKPNNTAKPGATVTVTQTQTQGAPPPTDDQPDGENQGTGETGDPSADGASSVTQADEQSLTTMSPISENSEFAIEAAAIDGKDYSDAFVVDSGCGSTLEFNLNRDWKELNLVAGIEDNSPNSSARLIINIDGKPLFNEQIALGEPHDLKLDVSGGLRLSITVEDPREYCSSGIVGLGSPMLTR